jgi:hypothetical protein
MAYTQRPCVCGGTDFLVLPNMQLHHGASTHTTHIWLVTSVVCTTCTRTEMFTANADTVASHLTGVRTISAGPQ